MSYLLASTSIRRPNSMREENSTQVAQVRTLSGAVNRDYFGSNKRIWTLEYKNTTLADFTIINAIYQTYLASGIAKAWQVTETNYPIAATTVHIDLLSRDFGVGGAGYISDFTLVLTEA